jgi:hypothetical protein
VSGGNIESAIAGAFSAGLFFGVGELGFASGSWQNVAAHAAAGCISAGVQGGNCGQGALSAGFAEFAGPRLMTGKMIADTTVHATLGGIGSLAGGGKFGNGAITGAFGYLYNKSLHGAPEYALDAEPTEKDIGGGIVNNIGGGRIGGGNGNFGYGSKSVLPSLSATEIRAAVRESATPFGNSGQAFSVKNEAEMKALISRVATGAEKMLTVQARTQYTMADGTVLTVRANSTSNLGLTLNVNPAGGGKYYTVHIAPPAPAIKASP